MTEQEWLASDDVVAMLDEMNGRLKTYSSGHQEPVFRLSDRKLRLFACACARQVWHLLTDDAPCRSCDGLGGFVGGATGDMCPDCNGTGRVNRSRRAVEVAERFADGEATARQMEEAGYAVLDESEDSQPLRQLVAVCCHAEGHLDIVRLPGRAKEVGVSPATQVALLRCIAGNPFRPVKVRAGAYDGGKQHLWQEPWLTPTVLSLAQAAYEERPGRICGRYKYLGIPHPETCDCRGTGRIDDGTLDPVRLAVLADALEEAGCGNGANIGELERSIDTMHSIMAGCYSDDAYRIHSRRLDEFIRQLAEAKKPHPLLAHLRSPGPHVRGYWVIDLILGKD